jgi:hypothetical protein
VGQLYAGSDRLSQFGTSADQLTEISQMKLFARITLVIVSALLGVSAAQGEEQDKHHACHADVQKLCKGVQPGGGRIAMCLKQHESELSSECRERMAAAKEQGKEFAQACKADAEKLCSGVKPGQGRVAACLMEHQDQLSGACKEKMAQVESRHPCMQDMQRLCKGVQPGAGRMMQCLKQHEAELSPECKAHQGREAGSEKK